MKICVCPFAAHSTKIDRSRRLHTCPNKIFSGLIQAISHALPMNEGNKPAKPPRARSEIGQRINVARRVKTPEGS